MFIYAQDESIKGCAKGEGKVKVSNNCQGSFLCNICILMPFYASCMDRKEMNARAAAAHLPCGLSAQWNQTAKMATWSELPAGWEID